MFNRAKALDLWFRREGVTPDRIDVTELATGQLTFEVELADQGTKPVASQRTRYEEFIQESPFIEEINGQPHIWPSALQIAAKLPDPDDDCQYIECGDSAEEHVIFVSVDEYRSYCHHHAARARRHFFRTGLKHHKDLSHHPESNPV